MEKTYKMSVEKVKQEDMKNSYSHNELIEFRETIKKKLNEAVHEYDIISEQLRNFSYHGTDNTAGELKLMEDVSETNAKEELNLNAGRLKKFIEALKAAAIRIENKSYGICRVTGKLIPRERLLAVPHTTVRIEAKLDQKKAGR